MLTIIQMLGDTSNSPRLYYTDKHPKSPTAEVPTHYQHRQRTRSRQYPRRRKSGIYTCGSLLPGSQMVTRQGGISGTMETGPFYDSLISFSALSRRLVLVFFLSCSSENLGIFFNRSLGVAFLFLLLSLLVGVQKHMPCSPLHKRQILWI